MSDTRPAIREWPQDDRPREKLLRRGEAQLSNSELVAILLRTGRRGESALDLARRIMDQFKTFRHMSRVDERGWAQFSGVGPAKVAQIRAALEIGRRFREDETSIQRPKIKQARDIADILMPQMRDLKVEVFKAVFLDSQNRILSVVDIARGTVNHAYPILREVFARGLQCFAVSMICVHNHPSGNVTSSPEDRQFTRELKDAGRLMGITLLDHIIIGDNIYYSFADDGQLNDSAGH